MARLLSILMLPVILLTVLGMMLWDLIRHGKVK